METLINVWESIKGWVLGGGLLTALGTIIAMACNISKVIKRNGDDLKIAKNVTDNVIDSIKGTTLEVNLKEYTNEMLMEILSMLNVKFEEEKRRNVKMAELIAIIGSYFEDSAMIDEEKKKELKAKIAEIKGENVTVEPIKVTIEEKAVDTSKSGSKEEKKIER